MVDIKVKISQKQKKKIGTKKRKCKGKNAWINSINGEIVVY